MVTNDRFFMSAAARRSIGEDIADGMLAVVADEKSDWMVSRFDVLEKKLGLLFPNSWAPGVKNPRSSLLSDNGSDKADTKGTRFTLSIC